MDRLWPNLAGMSGMGTLLGSLMMAGNAMFVSVWADESGGNPIGSALVHKTQKTHRILAILVKSRLIYIYKTTLLESILHKSGTHLLNVKRAACACCVEFYIEQISSRWVWYASQECGLIFIILFSRLNASCGGLFWDFIDFAHIWHSARSVICNLSHSPCFCYDNKELKTCFQF